MVQRINVADNETPDRARKRFDGQLGVRNWATPDHDMTQPDPQEPGTPWWWDKTEADQSSQMFMEMARARGRI